MPGFRVSGITQDIHVAANGSDRPFFTHTWEIPTLFGLNTYSEQPQVIYVKEATGINWNVRTDEVEGGSLAYKYAESVGFDPVKLTFYDIARGKRRLIDLLRVWRGRVWSPTTGIRTANEYKADTTIRSYPLSGPSTGEDGIGYQWTLFGSWPSNISSGDLTYTADDVKLVQVTVSYDYAEADTTPVRAVIVST